MLEKDAGGEIVGGALGALARPFVGAAKSTAVRNKVVGALTSHVNEPFERLLHRLGVGQLIEPAFYAGSKHRDLIRGALEKAHSVAMLPFPIDPAQKALYAAGRAEEIAAPHFADYAQRSAYAKQRAADVVKGIADHPDAAAFSAVTTALAPVPGITEGYLATKALAAKGLQRLSSGAPAPAVRTFHETRPPMGAEPTYLKTPMSAKEAAAYLWGRRAALEKYATGWNDLAPVVRRMIAGGAIGGVGGAATGAALSDEDHHGSGALKGGLIGAVGGAGLGAGYNAMRPIKPLAMPGKYYGNVGLRTRTRANDFESVFHRAPTGRRPETNEDLWSMTGRRDAARRPIPNIPVMETDGDLGHLRMDNWRAANGHSNDNVISTLGDFAHDPRTDTLRPSIPAVPAEFDLSYPGGTNGAITHDPKLSPSENELRRLLRKAGR